MHGPRLCSASSDRTMLRIARETLRCVRGTRAVPSYTAAPTASLRAQRSNPDCRRGKFLDCFAALAMTECAAP
ncbi:hypothetical protein DAA51_30580 [Bradyrhizobium sp. WBAH10]|nr:hypothetical protein [Bradyrhizobium sp. WBAH30]MDD1542092.1 hypothetical protein [Bradyrhizobium sp. WBAH41]MDD1556244.1 hypothetical protein [Bradyrhizobium sp. WBAH23]MDD1561915.1 hypothetical protein [Bradyrhizobium sp. WBAH33]MDD1589064.1 hypothetical protein [Bradyrhizobium sp. WBAH42]NRB87561.1 hypothetical protein [Bradyrhizobium sp. WBAH10]QCJ92391.1 hypothetical protein DAA57_30825 [Bradyrhizobium yuanmingense]